jgi:hypothetical protein
MGTMNALYLGNPLTREGVVLAILAAVLLLGAVLVMALRTRALPVCWNCGHYSVRRSRSRRLLDIVSRAFLLRPYRCEKCLQRFYCFHFRRVPGHSASRSIAATGRS